MMIGIAKQMSRGNGHGGVDWHMSTKAVWFSPCRVEVLIHENTINYFFTVENAAAASVEVAFPFAVAKVAFPCELRTFQHELLASIKADRRIQGQRETLL
jgi:hypothetical protein